MRGVSEVIAIILILMITISIAGLAYTFMSSTMASTTAAASSAVDTTTSSMLTSFTIESININKLYVRNSGQNTINSLSVYVNDAPADIIMSPITVGQVGTVTITDFLNQGDSIKVMAPNGMSSTKTAPDQCSQAIICMSFNEGSGTRTYSSVNSYGGTLRGTTTWTSGYTGGAIQFMGIGQVGARVNVFDSPDTWSDIPRFKYTGGDLTLSAWVKVGPIENDGGYIISKGWNGMGRYNYHLIWSSGNTISFVIRGDDQGNTLTTTQTFSRGQWHYVAAVATSSGSMKIYVNGVLISSGSYSISAWIPSPAHYGDGNVPLCIGGLWPYTSSFEDGSDQTLNATIDEVRVYDRALY